MENKGPDYEDTLVNGSSVTELMESLLVCAGLKGLLMC